MTTGEGAAWGGLFGGLVGAMLAAPFTGGASAAAVLAAGSLSGVALGATAGAVDAETWKEDFGISEDFVQRIGTLVQPDSPQTTARRAPQLLRSRSVIPSNAWGRLTSGTLTQRDAIGVTVL